MPGGEGGRFGIRAPSLVRLASERIVQLLEPLPHSLGVLLEPSHQVGQLAQLMTRFARQLFEQLLRRHRERELGRAVGGRWWQRFRRNEQPGHAEQQPADRPLPQPRPDTRIQVDATLQPHQGEEATEHTRRDRPTEHLRHPPSPLQRCIGGREQDEPRHQRRRQTSDTHQPESPFIQRWTASVLEQALLATLLELGAERHRQFLGAEPGGEKPPRTPASLGAGSVICFARTSVALPASNGSVPERAKYPTTPSAYRSLRASTHSPSACSGLMNSGVPITSPPSSPAAPRTNPAIPQSATNPRPLASSS